MSTGAFIQQLFDQRQQALGAFPDKEKAGAFIDRLFTFLFLPDNSRHPVQADLELEYQLLEKQFHHLVSGVAENEENAREQTTAFFRTIPALYKTLLKDARAIWAFDPAAGSLEEVLVAYPGFYATAIYRLSHQLWKQQVAILPRLFTEYAHSKTGVDIHPAARIGEPFCIDHGTGIVIGATTVIGNNVKIYQGVTLGALHIVSKDKAGIQRHPTIEDDVTIYAGATILGGKTVIGRNSIIGGNVWLTNSVAPESVVYHNSEVKVRDKNPFPEPVNFVI